MTLEEITSNLLVPIYTSQFDYLSAKKYRDEISPHKVAALYTIFALGSLGDLNLAVSRIYLSEMSAHL